MKTADRIKLVGSQLLQGNLGNAVKALTFEPVLLKPNLYRGNSIADNWYIEAGTNGKYFYYQADSKSSLKAYLDCPPVSAIIGQKAQAYINGKTWVVDVGGKRNDKESKKQEANMIRNLLNQPNPYQSFDAFEMQCYINSYIYGYTVILPIKNKSRIPYGFPMHEATQLWALPGNMVTITENDDNAFLGNSVIKNIIVKYKNTKTSINPESVFIMRDFLPSFNSLAIPESRINLLEMPINNIMGAYESRNSLIRARGPRFVVSNDGKDAVGATPWTPDQKDDIQQQFKQRYGLLEGQSQAIISSATLSVQPIGYDVKELGLFEEVADSSSMLCVGLGFPKFLAGLSDPTFNNQAAAEKALYQRFIIPDSINFYGQWNKFFNTAQYGINIQKDYSEHYVLQEDEKELATSRRIRNAALSIEWQAGMITLNDWIERNGGDRKTGEDNPDERFDMYYPEYSAKYGLLKNINDGSNSNESTGNAGES